MLVVVPCAPGWLYGSWGSLWVLVSVPEHGCCQGRILLVKYPQYPPGMLAHEMSRAVVLQPPQDSPLAALPLLSI